MGPFSNFAMVGDEPAGWDGFGKNWSYFDAGDEVEVTGDITYESTENGWRATEHSIKSYRITCSKKEAILSRLVGKWVGNTIYLDTDQREQRGAEQRCEFIRDSKGVKFVSGDGQVLAQDDAYLAYKSGTLYGNYVTGKHGGTHGAQWITHFTLQLRDDGSLHYNDSTWKHEYRKQ